MGFGSKSSNSSSTPAPATSTVTPPSTESVTRTPIEQQRVQAAQSPQLLGDAQTDPEAAKRNPGSSLLY
jgi:hypothetical protein